MRADLVWLQPPPGSTLDAVLAQAESPEHALGAALALAREDAVAAVWIGGRQVHARGMLRSA
jgi:guanine deaminase